VTPAVAVVVGGAVVGAAVQPVQVRPQFSAVSTREHIPAWNWVWHWVVLPRSVVPAASRSSQVPAPSTAAITAAHASSDVTPDIRR